MKLILDKNKLKNLSLDNNVLPADMTPQVGGGGIPTHEGVCTHGCIPNVTDSCACSIGSCGCDSIPNQGNCNTNTCW